jgi:HEPN domain-containing protein
MPLDPELVAEIRGWLSRIALDLRAAEHEFTAAPPLLDDIVFHAQQAAEKSFKAFLTWRQVPFRKTHNLEELGEQCLRLEPTLKEFVDRAVPLTEYAWKFRYPGEMDTPTEVEARTAVDDARAVHDAILRLLPAEVRL